MPDGAIVIPDTAAAPKDYTLSGTQEIQLKSVRAVVDGSGAATAFLPTLQLLDPNGHVMWEGATSSTVAAGGSADVSWFPGLGASSGSGTTTGAEWFQATHLTAFTVGGLSTNEIPWTAHQTSDSSLFTLGNTFGANTVIQINSPGVTLMSVSASTPEIVAWPGAVGCFSVSDAELGSYGNNFLTDIGAPGTPAGQSDVMRDYRISVGLSSPFELFCKFSNFDGVARSINSVAVGVVWWPNATLAV